jgi:hypothetical protein
VPRACFFKQQKTSVTDVIGIIQPFDTSVDRMLLEKELNGEDFCFCVAGKGVCWKSASLAGKRIRFGTNRVTISEPIGWNHRRVIQLPCDLHLTHTDIHCVYLILSLFLTGYEPGCTLFSVTVPQDSIKSRLAASRPAATRQLLQDQRLQ